MKPIARHGKLSTIPAEAQDSSADGNTDILMPDKEHTNSPKHTADEKEGHCIFGRRLKDCAYAK